MTSIIGSNDQTRINSEWQPTEKELECHRCLRTSDYESHKERNPDRVDGTCQWFLEHPHYNYWLKSNTSSLLWVSADPGCGKSVLAKSLVARELKSTETHTTCYFFFKDDNVDQKSAANALCALLHQLFDQRKPLIKHAMSDFRSNGMYLSGLFDRLWNILKEAAADPEAGKITCIIDALDECEELGRNKLLSVLDRFYNSSTGTNRRNMALKFLITSRPYFHIERHLENLISKYPVIRLAGEEETHVISREINLVIKVEVQNLGRMLKLDESVQMILENGLVQFTNRTYLWLHLVIEEVRSRLEVTSQKQIREILTTIPGTVDKAYSAILERSENKQSAKKLLHIIVCAIRPLTLQEMNVAMTMKQSCTSYDDLDLMPEDQWKSLIRNLCGLFVNVIDSRIYLIHQTAREFLLFSYNSIESIHDESYAGSWKHSLKLEESNLILAQACIWYLLFSIFEAEPLAFTQKTKNPAPIKDDVLNYTMRHIFLEYAAEYWSVHLRESKDAVDIGLLQSVCFNLCNTQSLRFSTWFQVYWTMSNPYETFPHGLDNLMIGSHLGLTAIVQLLLQQGFNISNQDHLNRMALSWAANSGHAAVVKLLLDHYGDLNSRSRDHFLLKGMAKVYQKKIKSVFKAKINHDSKSKLNQISSRVAGSVSYHTARIRPQQRFSINHADAQGRTSLILAAMSGHINVVELLLKSNSNIYCMDVDGNTALDSAAQNGHEDVVVLLLKKMATVKFKSYDLGLVLILAACYGQEAVINLLLDRKVNIESKTDTLINHVGFTPLLSAASSAQAHVVKLLLENNANIEAKAPDGRTPLACASGAGCDAAVAVLLEHGANIEAKDKAGKTPLSQFFIENGWPSCQWGAVRQLLEYGARIESKDHSVILLLAAARSGKIGVAEILLKRNLDIESRRDYTGITGRIIPFSAMTPLMLAAVGGHRNMVDFLLGLNANIEARDDVDGRTPLSWAASAGRTAVIDVLLEHNANIEARDHSGKTPLILAVQCPAHRHSFSAVMEILLDRGANTEAKDNKEDTPLLLAVATGYAEVVKLLLEHKVRIDYKNKSGKTPLQLAEHLGDKAIITLLLKYNADINSLRIWSRTPLSEAAEKGHTVVVQQLLGETPDIEAKDDIFGQSPLSWAAENGHEAIVRLLLGCNAQLESRNHYGQTPLWLAARYGHFYVVKLLVERNAIIDAEDNISRTPLFIAEYHGHNGIYTFLLRKLATQRGTV